MHAYMDGWLQKVFLLNVTACMLPLICMRAQILSFIMLIATQNGDLIRIPMEFVMSLA